jgi:hypothetical protein
MDDTEAKYMVEFPDNEHGMIVVSDATPHQAALKACRKADWDTTDFPIAKKGECHCVVTDLSGGKSYSVNVVVVNEPQYRVRLWEPKP